MTMVPVLLSITFLPVAETEYRIAFDTVVDRLLGNGDLFPGIAGEIRPPTTQQLGKFLVLVLVIAEGAFRHSKSPYPTS